MLSVLDSIIDQVEKHLLNPVFIHIHFWQIFRNLCLQAQCFAFNTGGNQGQHGLKDLREVCGMALQLQLAIAHVGKISDVPDQLIHSPAAVNSNLQLAYERRSQAIFSLQDTFTKPNHTC